MSRFGDKWKKNQYNCYSTVRYFTTPGYELYLESPLTHPMNLAELNPENRSSKTLLFFLLPSLPRKSKKPLRCGRRLNGGRRRRTGCGTRALGGLAFSVAETRAAASVFSRNNGIVFWKVVPPRTGDAPPCTP